MIEPGKGRGPNLNIEFLAASISPGFSVVFSVSLLRNPVPYPPPDTAVNDLQNNSQPTWAGTWQPRLSSFSQDAASASVSGCRKLAPAPQLLCGRRV